MKNRYLFKAKIKGNNTGDKELDYWKFSSRTKHW